MRQVPMLQVAGRRAFSTECKLMFAAEVHPQSRISIHRCYKRVPGRGVAERLEGMNLRCRGVGMRDSAYELRRIPIPRTWVHRAWLFHCGFIVDSSPYALIGTRTTR